MSEPSPVSGPPSTQVPCCWVCTHTCVQTHTYTHTHKNCQRHLSLICLEINRKVQKNCKKCLYLHFILFYFFEDHKPSFFILLRELKAMAAMGKPVKVASPRLHKRKGQDVLFFRASCSAVFLRGQQPS